MIRGLLFGSTMQSAVPIAGYGSLAVMTIYHTYLSCFQHSRLYRHYFSVVALADDSAPGSVLGGAGYAATGNINEVRNDYHWHPPQDSCTRLI